MQGFYLAYFDKPFFNEEIEAWMYGPVVPSIYRECKRYGNKGIAYKDEVVTLDTEEEEDLFNEVYRAYNKDSVIELKDKTHSEEPWRSTATRTGKKSIIKKDIMKNFFKVELKKDKKMLEKLEMLEDVRAYDKAKVEFEKDPKSYTLEELEKSLGYAI